MKSFKIFLAKFFCFMVAIAIASPIANCTIVEEVGTIFPGPASFTSGVKILISDALYRREFFWKLFQLTYIFLFLFANCIMFFNSIDSPITY